MGCKEAMPIQGSHEAWCLLQPEGQAVLGQMSAAQGRLFNCPQCHDGTADSERTKAGLGL